jgi:TnpA family transposase
LVRSRHRPARSSSELFQTTTRGVIDVTQTTSHIQPDTVHADTHGQSAAIFGLAYILGIQLIPRIRNWKHLTLYRSSK